MQGLDEEKVPRRSFRIVHGLMIFFALLLVLAYGSVCERYGRNRAIAEIRAMQYHQTGEPYCWMGPEIFVVRGFNPKTLTVKVKREDGDVRSQTQ